MSKESPHQNEKVFRIKNMVCPRCTMVVRDELKNLGLCVLKVELGTAVVEAKKDIDEDTVEAALILKGFELLHDKREELVESTKLAVIELIYSEKICLLTTNISTYLVEELGKDYPTISSVFKTLEGVALSRYIVLQKVERAKELLAYNELSVSAIATKLGYKSLQHMSGQFKEVTGTTPNNFRKQGGLDRHPIDSLY